MSLIRPSHDGWEFEAPNAITEELKDSAKLTLAWIEEKLRPAKPEQIAVRVEMMAKHYFEKQLSKAEATALARDWLFALKSFPYWAIDEACSNYVATDPTGRKPVPGAIAKLCGDIVAKHTALKRACLKVGILPLTPARIEPCEETKARVNTLLADLKNQLKGELNHGI